MTLASTGFGSWAGQPQVGRRLFDVDPSEVGRAALEHGSRMHVADIMVVLGLVLTLISALSVLGWLMQQRLQPHRLVVFSRLGKALGLGLRDRWLLWRIARHEALPTPTALLLTPGTLGHAARRHALGQGRRRGPLALARAASIRRHLFGQPLP